MQNESNNLTFINDLDGPLREAVEQICSSDVPHVRLNACLDRVMSSLPSDVQSNDRQAVSSKPTALVSRARNWRRWIFGIVTVAALTLMLLFHFGSTSVSLADVAQAVSRKTWIHVNLRASAGETDSLEEEAWHSPIHDVSATRRKEWIRFEDHRLKVDYSYDATERVLYRVPELESRRQSQLLEVTEALPRLLASGTAPEDPLSKLEFLGSRREDLTVVNQKTQKVMDGGHEWLDYTVMLKIRGQEQPIKILFRVDPISKLPHLVRVTGHHNGQTLSVEAAFDYPETGPDDIYALGVPRDAKLVDRVPTDDVARLIAGVAAGWVRFDDFRAVVVHTHWAPEVMYRKGNCSRRDMGFTLPSTSKPPDDVDVRAWWIERAEECRYSPNSIVVSGTEYWFKHKRITEPDGSQREEIVSVRPIKSGQEGIPLIPSFYSLTPDYAGRPPMGIPSQDKEVIVETDPGDGPEGTVLLRVRRSGRLDAAPIPDDVPEEWRFWIDPAREYLVMRWDMQGGNDDHTSSSIVESVAQSPKGHWYPTRVRRTFPGSDSKDDFTDFYVEFDVEIPDALFDVKKPLPVEELFHKTP